MLPNQRKPVPLDADVLADTIDELDEQSGGSSTIAVVGHGGDVQFRFSGGPDAVRASAGAALLMMRHLALPGAPTCASCAKRLETSEAALRALGVDERLWSMIGASVEHVH